MIDLLATVTEIATVPKSSPPQFAHGTSIVVILMMVVYAFIFGLIIICLIRLVKYLGSAKKEQKLMRMEMGKLAEEVHLIREEIKGKNPSESDS